MNWEPRRIANAEHSCYNPLMNPNALVLIAAMFGLASVGHAEWKMKVTRGNKVVSEKSDPATAQRDQADAAALAAEKASWAKAPKRAPGSPIYIVLH